MKHDDYFNEPVLKRLLLAKDRTISRYFPDEMFDVVLAGGAALMLFGANDKITNDIDILKTSNHKIDNYLFDYTFNGRVQGITDAFAENYEDRLIPLDEINKNSICLKYHLISLEDVVASKLNAGREKDKIDLKKANLKELINWDILDQIIYIEMRNVALNERRWKELVSMYEQYKEVIDHEKSNEV